MQNCRIPSRYEARKIKISNLRNSLLTYVAATYNLVPVTQQNQTEPLKEKREMTDNKAAKLAWFYTAVQHTSELTQVHRAAYNGETLITIDPAPQQLSDVSPSSLFDFTSQVLHGLANRPVVDAETFAAASARYAEVTAQEQATERAEEMENLR